MLRTCIPANPEGAAGGWGTLFENHWCEHGVLLFWLILVVS